MPPTATALALVAAAAALAAAAAEAGDGRSARHSPPAGVCSRGAAMAPQATIAEPLAAPAGEWRQPTFLQIKGELLGELEAAHTAADLQEIQRFHKHL